ncbi:response regulator [Arenibacter sp. GZD96]|uniref:hypothetical protein n=1 Tax=Aurantibrevibacter litoralis TaxID=3106030 RepID=UPI002AFEACC1|nr:hypothetical protein [Arenibacter sp. GZD-96]MEA1785143.1 response regulator [Arenibacter sp. GZD-96]
MFKKVLVVEDIDVIGFGIGQMLTKDIKIENVVQSPYCDDAYLKFLKALKDNAPFDLVISDLSFKKDHRESTISDGYGLLNSLKAHQPGVKTILYSVEDRPTKIRTFFNDHAVDGYVIKGRAGLKNLTQAILELSLGKTYMSPELLSIMHKKEVFEIEDYDIELLKQLSKGLTQAEISHYFTKNEVVPSSISAIEKRLNRLKIELKANNAIHLVANAKDIGLI